MQKDTLQMEGEGSLATATTQIHKPEAQIPYKRKIVLLVGLKGSTMILPDTDIDELRREFEIYSVCDRHKVAFLTKKGCKLHFKEEHAY